MRAQFEQKGSNMSRYEDPSQPPRHPGRSRSWPGRLSFGRLAAASALVLSLTAFASSALAAGPPRIKGELFEEHIHATRANVCVFVNSGPEDGQLKTSAEYAESLSGPWTAAGSETAGRVGEVQTGLGAGHECQRILQHLSPETTYFVRFRAKNANGEGEPATFSFTTSAVAKPEVDSESTFESIAIESLTATGSHLVARSSPTGVVAESPLETNGATTTYHFEFSTSTSGPWQPFTTGATGSVSVAEDVAGLRAEATGLQTETEYFVRIRVSNEKGSAEDVESFVTPTARPVVFEPALRNVTATSAYVTAQLLPHGSKTDWHFETAPSASGPWTPAPGAAGTVSEAEAEVLPEAGTAAGIEGRLTGLTPGTRYFVRLFAVNECAANCGEGHNSFEEPITTETRGIAGVQTSGSPVAITLTTHAVHQGAVRLLGTVNPESGKTSEEQAITIEGAPSGGSFTLTFAGDITASIPFDASAEAVRQALEAIPGGGPAVAVGGLAGGPFTIYFRGQFAESDQPQIEADAAGLTPAVSIDVATTQQGGESDPTHYHFEFEPLTDPGKAFAAATSTTPEEAPASQQVNFVGADLPSLQPGATYRYRLSASNAVGASQGEERTLAVPIATSGGSDQICENEALRAGPSANLPDCRGYEQLTPVDKHGAQELWTPGFGNGSAVAVGVDGDHLALESPLISWSLEPSEGQSPYFFSRAGDGWSLTAAAHQPQTGPADVIPELFTSDVNEYAATVGVHTSSGGGLSADTEFIVGTPQGPITTVASIPTAEVDSREGWVAASTDFSKLVLEAQDHELLGTATGTKSGSDLYEYSAGELRQANVDTEGRTIGDCGARIVQGHEGQHGPVSSPHAVSADGSAIFFEAVPTGQSCSQATHLYERVNGGELGAETVDLGAGRFLAANASAGEVLVVRENAGGDELLLYAAGHFEPTSFPVSALADDTARGTLTVSDDLSHIYFADPQSLTPEAPGATSLGSNLYRYDIGTGRLSFIAQGVSQVPLYITPESGGTLYFESKQMGGLPGGTNGTVQAYRYDTAEAAIECMSCASAFDPEPGLDSLLGTNPSAGADSASEGRAASQNGTPNLSLFSADGDFAFFTTPAALVPADVDGEEAPPELHEDRSLSTDVYEWRRDGVDGCGQIQGCLALITNGRGGETLLLGADGSGRNVFFYSQSQLGARDQDSAGDIYDARVDGGEPALPVRPVECEADACHGPATPPAEPTLSTSVSSGQGNQRPPKARPKHHRAKHHRHSGKRSPGADRGGKK
jgi:hypothetical protein